MTREVGEPVSKSIEMGFRLCLLDDGDSACDLAYTEKSREADDA